MSWSPNPEHLSQVGQLLQACADPSNHERHVQALQVKDKAIYHWCVVLHAACKLTARLLQMLDAAKREMPDFGCYMLLVRLFILKFAFSISTIFFARGLTTCFVGEDRYSARCPTRPWNLGS